MRRRGALVAIAIVAAAGVARADDVPKTDPAKDEVSSAPSTTTWASRPRQLNLQGGSLGGPLGYGGASFEWAPVPWVVGGAGVGGTPNGITAAFLPRLRLPITNRLAIGFGFPISLGPYEYVSQAPQTCMTAGCQIGYRTTRSWDLALWGHLEPNIEMRFGAIALRPYVGWGTILNSQSDRCTSTLAHGCPSREGEHRVYGGLALGYAF